MKKQLKYKVFEAKTTRQSFINCVSAGFRPLTALENLDAQARGLIPKNYYSVATLDIKKDGKVVGVRDATPEDIKKICDRTYQDSVVRPWYVSDLNNDRSAAGGGGLGLDDIIGRLCGVKEVKNGKRNKSRK